MDESTKLQIQMLLLMNPYLRVIFDCKVLDLEYCGNKTYSAKMFIRNDSGIKIIVEEQAEFAFALRYACKFDLRNAFRQRNPKFKNIIYVFDKFKGHSVITLHEVVYTNPNHNRTYRPGFRSKSSPKDGVMAFCEQQAINCSLPSFASVLQLSYIRQKFAEHQHSKLETTT